MCDHCNKGFWEKKKCLHHEVLCLKNPDRVCGMCKELGVTQRPLSYYESDELSGYWYGDVDELRKAAQGCPLCMLAAKMAVDPALSGEDRWVTFDYEAEMKRVEQEKWHDGIPF
jgi:hypothetical protein